MPISDTRRELLRAGAAVGLGLSAGCLSSVSGGGQEYPSQTVNWWIPYSKGGGMDAQQQSLVPHLEDELGVSIAPENVTGGGGGVAYKRLSNEIEPDGYTLIDGERHDWGANDVLTLPRKPDGNTIQHVNADPDRRVRLAIGEPLFESGLGYDMGCGFVQIEPCPEY